MNQQLQFSDLLSEAIQAAIALEDADQHLDPSERQAVVDLFKKENPGVDLPNDLDDAYVKIIYDLAM